MTPVARKRSRYGNAERVFGGGADGNGRLVVKVRALQMFEFLKYTLVGRQRSEVVGLVLEQPFSCAGVLAFQLLGTRSTHAQLSCLFWACSRLRSFLTSQGQQTLLTITQSAPTRKTTPLSLRT